MSSLFALLRRFTIRARMLGAVAMVIAMFAIIGGTGLVGGLQLKALNHEVAASTTAGLQLIAQLRGHLATVRTAEKQMVIDYENGIAVLKQRELWAAEVDATRKALADLLAQPDSAAGQNARRFVELLDAYATATKPVLDQVQNGAYDNTRTVDKMLGRAKQNMTGAEAELDKLAALVNEQTAAGEARFDRAMTLLAIIFGGTLAVIVAIVAPLTLLNARSIIEPMRQARDVARAIAAGDLTQTVNDNGRDETSELLRALAEMQQWLQGIVGDVRGASSQIEVASREVAAGNADLSQRTEQTAGSLQQTASSMEQLTGTVGQSADAARQANQLAGSAAEVAQRGGKVVAEVVSTMVEINSSSKKIADIIGVIDGIAFQTNILALNAAVEAARAGEQGRGFAVVAGEVRSLAQRSAGAAREIKGLIGNSVEKVESGSRLVADAGTTMGEIVASVQRVADIIGEISAAAAEQTAGIGQINGAVNTLDEMTQQNAALVEQSAAAATSLSEQAARLAALVGRFRLHNTPAPAALAATAVQTARASAAAAPKPAAKPVTKAAPKAAAAVVPKPAATPEPSAPAQAVAPAAAAEGEWTSF
jgi:methyl-accepting chemotaxis protein